MIKIFKGTEDIDEYFPKLVDLLNPLNYQKIYTQKENSIKTKFTEHHDGKISFYNE